MTFPVLSIDTEIAPYVSPFVTPNSKTVECVLASLLNPGKWFPTKTCYDDAFDFIEGVVRHHARRNKSTKHWRLCHGVLSRYDGEESSPWGHAWVELNDVVYDARLLGGERVYAVCNKNAWCGSFCPEYVVRYTIPKALEKLRLSKRGGNAGPWDTTIMTTGNHFLQEEVR